MKILSINSLKENYIFFVLIFLFFGPLFAAWILFNSGWRPSTINHGVLIQAPMQIATLPLLNNDEKLYDKEELYGKWELFYVLPHNCNKFCQRNLVKMRQVNLALGKNVNRLSRIVVSFKEKSNSLLHSILTSPQFGAKHLVISKKKIMPLLLQLPKNQRAFENGAIFIVDPVGNFVSAYPPEINPKSLLKDLERLMKVSTLG